NVCPAGPIARARACRKTRNKNALASIASHRTRILLTSTIGSSGAWCTESSAKLGGSGTYVFFVRTPLCLFNYFLQQADWTLLPVHETLFPSYIILKDTHRQIRPYSLSALNYCENTGTGDWPLLLVRETLFPSYIIL
ncbi:unnamed protein product, partial [Pylaiella littoralis]